MPRCFRPHAGELIGAWAGHNGGKEPGRRTCTEMGKGGTAARPRAAWGIAGESMTRLGGG